MLKYNKSSLLIETIISTLASISVGLMLVSILPHGVVEVIVIAVMYNLIGLGIHKLFTKWRGKNVI